jgi:hypothetical protein
VTDEKSGGDDPQIGDCLDHGSGEEEREKGRVGRYDVGMGKMGSSH